MDLFAEPISSQTAYSTHWTSHTTNDGPTNIDMVPKTTLENTLSMGCTKLLYEAIIHANTQQAVSPTTLATTQPTTPQKTVVKRPVGDSEPTSKRHKTTEHPTESVEEERIPSQSDSNPMISLLTALNITRNSSSKVSQSDVSPTTTNDHIILGQTTIVESSTIEQTTILNSTITQQAKITVAPRKEMTAFLIKQIPSPLYQLGNGNQKYHGMMEVTIQIPGLCTMTLADRLSIYLLLLYADGTVVPDQSRVLKTVKVGFRGNDVFTQFRILEVSQRHGHKEFAVQMRVTDIQNIFHPFYVCSNPFLVLSKPKEMRKRQETNRLLQTANTGIQWLSAAHTLLQQLSATTCPQCQLIAPVHQPTCELDKLIQGYKSAVTAVKKTSK